MAPRSRSHFWALTSRSSWAASRLVATARKSARDSGSRGSFRSREGLACVGDRDLPERCLPCVGKAQLLVDSEHLQVHVGVSGPDETRVRTLREDALEHHGLEPQADAVATMRRDDGSAFLLDGVRIEGVELDLS